MTSPATLTKAKQKDRLPLGESFESESESESESGPKGPSASPRASISAIGVSGLAHGPGDSVASGGDGPSGSGLTAPSLPIASSAATIGPAQKFPTVKEFAKDTDEGVLIRQGPAQKALISLIARYNADFVKDKLGIDKSKLPSALSTLLQMRDIVSWWIADHIVDVDNGLGGVATVEDPSRVKRMAGMRKLQRAVGAEIHRLQQAQRDDAVAVTDDVDQPSPGYIKLKKGQAEGAKSTFAKLGAIADTVAAAEGDSSELEAFVQFPVDPSGVGFIGGRIKGTISREDGFVKVAIELALTGGAKVAEGAQIAAELGGYFTAQGKTGHDAFLAISLGFYRRMRESHVVPAEMSSFIWGGGGGTYAKGKADDWSRTAEKDLWGGAKDAAAGDKTYIETGAQGQGRMTAKAGIGSAGLTAEMLLGAKTGRRVDFTSLQNRKGGAGERNLPSASVIAQGTRAITGGTRGAEKRTGRDVHTVSGSSTLTVDVPLIAAVSGKGEFKVEWMNDGKRASEGEKSATKMTSGEIKVTFAAGLKLRQMTGPIVSRMVERAAEQMADLMRSKLLDLTKEDPSAAEVALGLAQDLEAMAGGAGLEALVRDAMAKQVLDATGQTLKTLTSVGAAVIFMVDPVKDKASVEIKLEDIASLEIPSLLKVKLKNQKRIVKFSQGKDRKWKVE